MALDPFFSIIQTPDKASAFNASVSGQERRGRVYFICQRGSKQLVMSVDAKGKAATKIIEEPSYVKDMRSLSLYNDELFAVALGVGPG